MAQVTFSSVNFGTDTDEFAKMISRNLLLAFMAGLGDGENPIFPNLCFRVKSGVNLEPHTPNYDLFKLAISCVGKRIQPRFVFADSPAYTKWEEAGTMGCVDGKEIVQVIYKDQFYSVTFEQLWGLVDGFIHSNGKSDYVVTRDLKIWDGKKNGFVPVKTLIRNRDVSDWVQVKIHSCKAITVTTDHPLYIFRNSKRVRVEARDVKVGDTIRVYHDHPKVEIPAYCKYSAGEAYILGMLLVCGFFDKKTPTQIHLPSTDMTTSRLIASKVKSKIQKIWKKDIHTFELTRKNKEESHKLVIRINGKKSIDFKRKLWKTYGADKKIDAHIPQELFTAPYEVKLNFVCGMIDGRGVFVPKKGSIFRMSHIPKQIALGLQAILQSIDVPCKLSTKTARYFIEFNFTPDMLLRSRKMNRIIKRLNYIPKFETIGAKKYYKITSIKPIEVTMDSYDVETETDTFTLSFVQSGNCRTSVRSNVNGDSSPNARGNLAFNNINLPLIALESDCNYDKFKVNFNRVIDEAIDQLYDRYKVISNLKVKDVPFISDWYVGHEGLKPDDKVEPMVKHGSLSVGFIGLAECLMAMFGKHHGESEEMQKIGLDIVQMIRDKTDEATKKYNLNFSTFATPSESACKTLLQAIVKKFGIIKGVSDKEYLTNSSHLPVDFACNIQKKIDIEAPYHLLCNAGHIMYIEAPSTPKFNEQGMEQVISYMAKSGAVYGGINFPQDFCLDCHKDGTFTTCPYCGSSNVKRTAIITGYLSTEDRFNSGKSAELANRVSHTGGGVFA